MGKPYHFNQLSFRGRGDTVGLNVDTWDHALNTDWTQDTDEVFRVRYLVQETNGGATGALQFKWQYDHAGGGWNDVSATSPLQWALSGQYADDDATSQMIGSGSFTAGDGSEGDNLTTSVDIGADGETEFEGAFTIDSAQVTDAQIMGLRMVESGGTVFTAYSYSPDITVNEPAAVTDTGLFDGKVFIHSVDTDLYDGAALVHSIDTNVYDGLAVVANSDTSLYDGAALVHSVDTDTYDGKAIVYDLDTDTYDGKAVVAGSDTDTYDGKALVYDLDTDTYDGKAIVYDLDTDTYDGKAVVAGSDTDTYDGKALVYDLDTDTYDGKAIVYDLDTDTYDGKAIVYDLDTDLYDGKAIVTSGGSTTDIYDGKALVYDLDTDLYDGKAFVFNTDTGLYDGKAIVYDIDTGLYDGKAVVATGVDLATDLYDGYAIVHGLDSGIYDGKATTGNVTYTNTLIDLDAIFHSWENVNYGDYDLWSGDGSINMPYWRGASINDAIYFGKNSQWSSRQGEETMRGVYQHLRFNVGPQVIAVGYEYVWEYYGLADPERREDDVLGWWEFDFINDQTDGFQNAGIGYVAFTPPIGWRNSAVGFPARNCCWIRIRQVACDSMSNVGGQQNGNITCGENILRVYGEYDIHRLWEISDDNGWDIITVQGAVDPYAGWNWPKFYTYYINAYLAVGDGTNTESKLTALWSSIFCYRNITILNRSEIEVGRESSLYTDYGLEAYRGFGEAGAHLTTLDVAQERAYSFVDPGAKYTQWGGTFRYGNTPQISDGGEFFAQDTWMTSKPLQSSLQFYSEDVTLKRVTIQQSALGIRFYAGVTAEDVNIIGGFSGLWLGHTDGETNIAVARIRLTPTSTYQFVPVSYSPGGQIHNLDDSDISDEASLQKYDRYELGIRFRKTWSCTVVDIDGTPMEGVTVACANKDDDEEFSVETDASGQTGEQKIVRQYYHWPTEASGTYFYLADTDINETYSPFEFTLTKPGYNVVTIPGVTFLGGTTVAVDWRVVLLELANNILVVVGVIDVGDMVGTVPGPVRATELVGDTRG